MLLSACLTVKEDDTVFPPYMAYKIKSWIIKLFLMKMASTCPPGSKWTPEGWLKMVQIPILGNSWLLYNNNCHWHNVTSQQLAVPEAGLTNHLYN